MIVISEHRRPAELERLSRVIKSTLPGKRLAVEISAYAPKRSDRQNNYLNGVAYKLLSEATGYDRDDISEYLCGVYFGWKDKPMPGKRVVQIPIRTTTRDENGKRSVLKKLEFSQYVAFVQRFGAKHGVYIPDPDPEWFNDGFSREPPSGESAGNHS